MSNECVFCKIVGGEIPANLLHEDELCVAFYDIAPTAPVHFLLIPKEHLESMAAVEEQHHALMGHLMVVIARLAKTLPLDGGYRVVSNCGCDAAQSVGHLHFHVIGGQKLSPSMG